MKVAVCIKQVPSTTNIKIDPKTNTLVREGGKAVINPFDTYALEEALRIKERCGGSVTVITMGPPQAEEALREAISLGTDEAILVSDRSFAGADTLATSYTLSKAIGKMGDFNLIICGKQTMDGDTGQVGPSLAERLNIAYITYVSKIEEINKDYMKAQRLVEAGHEVVETNLPALITVVKEINEPRLPSLKGKLLAKKVEIPIWSADDLGVDSQKIGLSGSPTQVIHIFTPKKERKSEVLGGSPEEQVKTLVEKLKQDKVV